MNLITVIACHNNDCIRAERLIDQIFALNNKEPKGHALILFAPSTPQENRDKVRISAEVAFKSVTILPIAVPKEIENQAAIANNKMPIVANVMYQAAKHIARHYRMPWLWLEPDSLPLKQGWMEAIEATYESQPMRYMAGHLKRMDGENEIFSISRMGVYPNDAIIDFDEAARLKMGFEFYAFSMSSKCRLFQNSTFDKPEDIEKIRPDAVLAHSDKRAVLVDAVVETTKSQEISSRLVVGKTKTAQEVNPAPSVTSAPTEQLPTVGSEANQVLDEQTSPQPPNPVKRRGRRPTVKPPFRDTPPIAAPQPKSFISTHEIQIPVSPKPLVTC